MRAGAWGLSTGLIYVPGRYARTDELIELARVVRRHGGLYASHIRNEGAGLLAAVDEAIAVGEGAEGPGAHLAPQGQREGELGHGRRGARADRRGAGGGLEGLGRPVSLHRLEHQAGGDGGPALGRSGGRQGVHSPRRRPGARRRAPRARSLAGWRRETAGHRSGSRGTNRAPSGPGSTSPPSPDRPATTPLEVVLDIQRHGGAQAISFGMSEEDVREVMRHPFVATASDGSTHLPGRGDRPHPRAYGTFPRKIRYALDEKVLSARAGDPVVLGLARRDPRPGRPRRHPRRGPLPTSSSSTRRRFAMPRRSTSRRNMRPGCVTCSSTASPLIADGRLRTAAGTGREAARAARCGCNRTARPS